MQMGGHSEAEGQECGHQKQGEDELAPVDELTQETD